VTNPQRLPLIARSDSALVETETGHKVVGFKSANHIEPDTAAGIFVFEPVGY
jgi:hypothetical protein